MGKRERSRREWFGECQCTVVKKNGVMCGKTAYYSVCGDPRCGRHGKREGKKLPPNPNAAQLKAQALELHEESIRRFAAENRSAGKRGQIRCTKMRMMKKVQLQEGFLNVFPNNRHQNRTDGFGCCALSPMRLTPTILPAAAAGLIPQPKNIENFHQGSKFFVGQTKEQFMKGREDMFRSDIPQRHNPAAIGHGHRKNVPQCFVWTRADGVDVEYDYVPSRQFYCTMMERALLQQPDYLELVDKLQHGTNLNICGYDAYDLPDEPSANSIEQCYLDGSRPFGHELVIATMLLISEDDWPWRRHITETF